MATTTTAITTTTTTTTVGGGGRGAPGGETFTTTTTVTLPVPAAVAGGDTLEEVPPPAVMMSEPEPEPEQAAAPPAASAPVASGGFSSVFEAGAAAAESEEADRVLAAFLEKGGCSVREWDVDALAQLGAELRKGEATLGYDESGKAKRVVSVAKPVLYDGAALLVEAFQTFQKPGKTKVKCTGMSEKFNPLAESCQRACVRAVAEELKLTVTLEDFCENPWLDKKAAGSVKFAGLPSEYHLYYCAMASSTCQGFQAEGGPLPKGRMTAVAELDSSTNPKTLWWAWCPDPSSAAGGEGAGPGETEALLTALTADTAFAGAIDFSKRLKLGSPGEMVGQEIKVAKQMIAQGLDFCGAATGSS